MKKILIALGLSIALMSCTTASFSGLQVASELPAHEVVGEFEITVSVAELLGSPGGANLLNITADAMDPAVTNAIMAEVAGQGGDAAIDVTIVQSAELMDLIIAGVTGMIYSPTTYTVTGTVIKW